LQNGINKIKYN